MSFLGAVLKLAACTAAVLLVLALAGWAGLGLVDVATRLAADLLRP